MKIKLKGEYKSLVDFTSSELPDFTVITGENGSGKTQLITLIKELGKNGQVDYSFSITDNEIQIKNIHAGGIESFELGGAHNSSLVRTIRDNLNLFKSLKEGEKLILDAIETGFVFNKNKPFEFNKLNIYSDEEEFIKHSKELISSFNKNHRNNFSKWTVEHFNNSLNTNFAGKHGIIKFLYSIKKEHDINIVEIKETEFYNLALSEKVFVESDLFRNQLGTLYVGYMRRRFKNDFGLYRKTKGDQNDSIEDDEFLEKYPAPWTLINSLLSKLKSEFRISEYDLMDYSDDIEQIDVCLTKKDSDTKIYFDDLSSGERVILGLVDKLFSSSYYEKELKLPELLVLDEPDAHLHPEMTKLLIDVLNETFVQELGIKVVITTHSPSTIALSPDDSIFKMSNGSSCSLSKITKDEALDLLTGFLPTLSIDYKNHKQVFVESPTDVYYFQSLFNRVNQESKMDYKLYFMSNAMGEGNCGTVNRVVESVRESGIKTSYGVVDRDEKNYSASFTEGVFVHGENDRWSIENYLLDPIYMTILFIEKEGAHDVYNGLGIDAGYNQFDLREETQGRLQEVVDWYLSQIYIIYPAMEKLDSDRRSVVFLNEISLEYPKWYLDYPGHKLEAWLSKVFPIIEGYRSKGEGELQRTLTNISIKCYPLVHSSSVKVLEEIVDI